MRRVRLVFALLLAALAPLAAPHRAGAEPPPPAGRPIAAVHRVGGVPSVGANDLARLLDAAKFWRADTRKLVLRTQGHRLTFTVDAPIVLLDDRTLRLDAPVRSVRGELQVPVSLLPLLPRDSTTSRLVLDAGGNHVRVAPPDGFVGMPRVTHAGDVTRVTIAADRAEAASVIGRGRERFRLRLPGVMASLPADTLQPGTLVRALRRVPAAAGVVFEFDLAAPTAGYRLLPEPQQSRVVLEFSTGGAGFEPFAPEGPAGPRALRVVVLDPGHGGDDAGVRVEGLAEKDLTLALARLLAAELERRSSAHVVLTRQDDRFMSQDERAEAANRARADVVLSLHFDGLAGSRACGATAWCPPASFAEGRPDARTAAFTPVAMTPWRDVAVRHAVESRALADAVTDAMERHGVGPARVRERLPVPLLGVNAPGLALECATLTFAADRHRLTAPDGLRVLAAAIADGLLAYQRHD